MTKENWLIEITDLEYFFKNRVLPTEIVLDKTTKITNVQKMVTSHIEIITAQAGNNLYLPYLMRLVKLKYTLQS